MDLITVAIIVVLISIVSSLFAVLYRKHSLRYWQSRNVPCIEPSFIYGNMERVAKDQHLAYALKDIYDKFKKTGEKFCGVYFWSDPVAFILDLDLMKNILIKDFNNFSNRGLYRNTKHDPLTNNVSVLDGDELKSIRSKLSPAFSSGKMKYIFPTVVQVAESLNDALREYVSKKGDKVKLKNFLLRYTSDAIGTVAFGVECNSLKDPNSEFMNMIRILTTKPRFSARFYMLLNSFQSVGQMLRIKIIPDEVTDFFMKMVPETVAYREKNNVRRNDLMDILISLKNQSSSEALTLNEVVANAFVFFFGGFETSSAALLGCFYALAMNPDVQTKARASIRKGLEKHNGEYTYEMFTDLVYIEQIVRETLRMYPISGSLNRYAKNDYPVPGTNHVIEKGTRIKLPVYAVHLDPDIYPDPEKFDPDRFESSKFRERHTMAWCPFGDGPRGCIGQRFALMNMQIVVTMVLRDFEILQCEGTPKTIIYNPKRTFLTPQDIVFKLRPNKL